MLTILKKEKLMKLKMKNPRYEFLKEFYEKFYKIMKEWPTLILNTMKK